MAADEDATQQQGRLEVLREQQRMLQKQESDIQKHLNEQQAIHRALRLNMENIVQEFCPNRLNPVADSQVLLQQPPSPTTDDHRSTHRAQGANASSADVFPSRPRSIVRRDLIGAPNTSLPKPPQAGLSSSADESQRSHRKRKRGAGDVLDDGDDEFQPRKSVAAKPKTKTRVVPSATRYPNISSDRRYSTIVRDNERVIELHCKFCHGNTSHKGLFLGVLGFQVHLQRGHGLHMSAEWVVNNCVKAVLTEWHAENVRRGTYTVEQKATRTTLPRVEEVNQGGKS